MPRFELIAIDEYGQAFPAWEGETLSEAYDKLERLQDAEEQATTHRSGGLREAIESLQSQIQDAEESEATVQEITDILFPGS